MDKRIEDKIIKIFKEKILTPILYMVQYDDIVDLVCFCDRSITMQTIYDTANEIQKQIDKQVEIIDIREFDEADRIEIMKNAQLLYSEDPIIERIFEESMIEDFRIMLNQREETMSRYIENSTPYLQ